jgi:hypothetical protein
MNIVTVTAALECGMHTAWLDLQESFEFSDRAVI